MRVKMNESISGKTFEDLIAELEEVGKETTALIKSNARNIEIMRSNDRYNHLVNLCWDADPEKMRKYVDADRERNIQRGKELARERENTPPISQNERNEREFNGYIQEIEKTFEYILDLAVEGSPKRQLNEQAKYIADMAKECAEAFPRRTTEYIEKFHEGRLARINGK